MQFSPFPPTITNTNSLRSEEIENGPALDFLQMKTRLSDTYQSSSRLVLLETLIRISEKVRCLTTRDSAMIITLTLFSLQNLKNNLLKCIVLCEVTCILRMTRTGGISSAALKETLRSYKRFSPISCKCPVFFS